MHELSIAHSILKIAEEHISQENNDKVKRIKLRIGEHSGVVPDSLEFCFQAITSGSSFENTTLEIDIVPFHIRCVSCNEESQGCFGMVICPKCGSHNTRVVSGTELQIVELEIDDGE